jgi:enoyl-CoA hydratase/carnithine racemase
MNGVTLHAQSTLAEACSADAGLEWMLNMDIVIAAQRIRFKLPEASFGGTSHEVK